jgi:predicted negative regulator of RcsB-dependent stress response
MLDWGEWMQNPFGALGLENDASAQQVRTAYHARVKLCHPDVARDAAHQQQAQAQLTALNLVYAEALRQATHRETHHIAILNPRLVAQKLLDEGHFDSALRALEKSDDRDAAWFVLRGRILLHKNEAEAAHACFRTALRLEPDNAACRELALAAGVAMRKQKTLRGKMSCWARSLVGRSV